MGVKEVLCKSALVPSKLPLVDYVINPYTGCVVGCHYCYATFMQRYTNHKEQWGKFLDVKTNIVDVLKKQLQNKKFHGKRVLLSSVTDPYQAPERYYRLTRDVLEELLKTQAKISILTKNKLVLRDVEVLKRFNECSIGISINSLNKNVQRALEPGSSTPQEKIDALKQLKQAGLVTYAFIGPVLPGITDVNEIVDAINPYVDEIMIETFNARKDIQNNMRPKIKKYFPHLEKEYEEFFTKRKAYNTYVQELNKIAGELRKKTNKKVRLFRH